jgi:hypothetical protein
MLNWRDYAGGQTAKAQDFAGKPKKGKITSAEVLMLKDKDGGENQRLCVMVAGIEKYIPINGRAGEAISKKYGDDATKWIGKLITISAVDTGKTGNFKYEWDIRPS